MPAGSGRVMGLSMSCLRHHVTWEQDLALCAVRTESAVVSLSVPCHCASSRSSETTTVLKHLSLPRPFPVCFGRGEQNAKGFKSKMLLSYTFLPTLQVCSAKDVPKEGKLVTDAVCRFSVHGQSGEMAPR